MSTIDRKECVVHGCKRRQVPGQKSVGHQFPRGKGRGSSWVELCRNEELSKLSFNEIISFHLFICTDHFTSNCFYFTQHGQRRLAANALPTLNLPEETHNNGKSEIAGINIDLPDKENFSSAINVSPKFDATVGKISCDEKCAQSPGIRESALNSSTLSPLKHNRKPMCKKRLSDTFEKDCLDRHSEKQTLPADCANNVQQDCDVQVIPVEKGEETGSRKQVENEIPQVGGGASSTHASTDCDVNVVSVETDQDKDENSRKRERAEGQEKDPEPKRLKSTKYHSLRMRPNNRSVFRIFELTTPLEKRLYSQLQEAREENSASKKKIIRLRKRGLKSVGECRRSKKFPRFEKQYSKMTGVQQHFINALFRNSNRKPHGRRYTSEEKIIALSIFKQSPKCYKFMRKFLPLPSPTALQKMLQNIPMDTGVTEETKRRLEEAFKMCKTEKDKVTFVMWDEVFLACGLFYDKATDKIVGFEDWGNVRTEKYADHALVFMMRMVESGDKIPLTFNFCSGQTTTVQLIACIKDVVGAIKEAGFTVVATVCDGGSSNQAAIKTLLQDTVRLKGEDYVYRNGTFILHAMEIIPLYDAPHLMKCVRNNLLDKDLEFDCDPRKDKQDRKFAKWEYVITAYEIDTFSGNNVRYVPKLTAKHVYPTRINKMKVMLTMNVFSGRFAGRIDGLAGGPARSTDNGPKTIPQDGANTAWVLSFFNKLSDSFNGSKMTDPHSEYRTLVTDTSYHLAFFDEAIAVLTRMRFVDKETKKPSPKQPPCLENLIKTIRGFKQLWRRLKELGFTSLKTRYINQDTLENFFSLIRGFSADRKPTCYHFIGIFKALVINTVTHCHSKEANCLDDEGNFVLPWQSYFTNEKIAERPLREVLLVHRILPGSRCLRDPIPEKGSFSADTSKLIKLLKKKAPSLKTCAECLALFQASASSCRIKELHNDIKSILRRNMQDLYATVGVRHRAALALGKEVRIERLCCKDHQQQVLTQILHLSIIQHIISISAYLVAILRGNIAVDIKPETNASAFVISAKAKYDSSLKSKQHTFSTLAKK